MAYELTKNNIESFNKRYGTNISFSEIQSQANRLNSFDAALKYVFHEAYKKVALGDLIKHDDDFLNSTQMIDDFNSSITNCFIDETPRSRRGDLKENLGQTADEQFYMMKAILEELPDNNIDVVAENYKNGNIRIRDMVSFANSRESYTDFSKKSVNVLASYAEALKKVNEGRSFMWRVFHPFRNNAEQRDSKKIQTLIESKIGKAGYKSAVARVSKEVPNYKRLEDETRKCTLNKIIDNGLDLDEKIDTDFEIKFDPDVKLTEEEKKEYINKLKEERLRSIEIEKAHKKELEFKAWLAKVNAPDNNINNNEEVNENVDVENPDNNEDVKKSLPLEHLKEDIYANNDSNQKIEDNPLLENNLIINN